MPEQKIVIDVAELFAKLDPKYKWIGMNKWFSLYGFTERPDPVSSDGWSMAGTRFTSITTEPKLFERPKPSAWKLGDCNLSGAKMVAYRYVFPSGNRGSVGLCAAREIVAMRRPDLELEWCEIPE